MAKRRRGMTAEKRERWSKEGRGQGEFADYKPWLTIHDVPSLGVATRVKGWTTGRMHHLLSNLELAYFYVVDWSPLVIDIREQYPLPIDETLQIARRLGIQHPIDPHTKEPNDVTTDFLLTLRSSLGFGTILQTRSLKYAKDLANKRTLQKLEIERFYWSSRSIDWGIVTDADIPETIRKNVEWIHPFGNSTGRLGHLTETDVAVVRDYLTPHVLQGEMALADLCLACDDRLALDRGASLGVARHLIAIGTWPVNMTYRIDPCKPVVLQRRQALSLTHSA